jgi:hypothetical protein
MRVLHVSAGVTLPRVRRWESKSHEWPSDGWFSRIDLVSGGTWLDSAASPIIRRMRMHVAVRNVFVCLLVASVVSSGRPAAQAGAAAQKPAPSVVQRIDLAQYLDAGKLRAVNRAATKVQGRSDGVHMDERMGNGLLWIEGAEFGEGTIELEVRGRDLFQQSFLGIAFHRRDDNTYDAVYLRPFNFRAEDPVRRQHAVQYIAIPDYDWPRLRKEFPEEFENPVDASAVPTDWVLLRVVVQGQSIQVYVGKSSVPALDVRKLSKHGSGMIGLWVGNGSDGDFANLRILR